MKTVNDKRVCYTYLIGWSGKETYYYGSRYGKLCHPRDLWVSYKTSSKYVKLFAEEFGDPDIIQVRKTFDSNIEACTNYETKVLRRMNVVFDERFLNRWCNTMTSINENVEYFPFQDKEIQKKVDSTLRERYGGRGSASDFVKNKVYASNTEKYGTHHTLHTEIVANSRKAASLKKYGCANPFNNKELQSAMKGVKFYCPFKCKDNHLFDVGNLTKHMILLHNWTKQEVKEYREECKD